MNDFGELSVNIKGETTYGSGILYQCDDESAFIITAKHCIYDENSDSSYLDLEIIDYKKERLEIIGTPIYPENQDLDLATIKVKIKRKYPPLLVTEPKINQRIVFFGYPEYRSSSGCGIPMRGKVTQIDKPHIFRILMENELSSSFNSEYDNTRGFSGAGIYMELDGKCYLVGIVTLLEGDGRNGIVGGVHVENISSFFEKDVGIKLLPSSFLDFREYLNDIIKTLESIEGQDNKLIYLIQQCYKENFDNITPEIIHENLNEYLVYPYQPTFDYANRLLWTGWLEILLCKLLQKNFDFSISDFFKISNNDKSRSGIHVLFTESITLGNFIGSLFTSELYDKIDDNDVLFVNNQKGKFLGDKLAKKNQIEGIVRCIDNPKAAIRLNIDDPDEKKLFPIVHLEYLEDEIARFLLETKVISATQFVTEFPDKLNEIFKEIEE